MYKSKKLGDDNPTIRVELPKNKLMSSSQAISILFEINTTQIGGGKGLESMILMS